MIEGELALALFGTVCVLLLFGFPVALTLAGTALLFAGGGVITGYFDASFVGALPGRMFGTVTNETLVAVPLFILMGVAAPTMMEPRTRVISSSGGSTALINDNCSLPRCSGAGQLFGSRHAIKSTYPR